MGRIVWIDYCPGKHRYINDLNNEINNLNNRIAEMDNQIANLESTIAQYFVYINEEIRILIELYNTLYNNPLLTEDNTYILNPPGIIDFTKEVVHRDHFTTMNQSTDLKNYNTKKDCQNLIEEIKMKNEKMAFTPLKNEDGRQYKEPMEATQNSSSNGLAEIKRNSTLSKDESSIMEGNGIFDYSTSIEGFQEGFCEHEDDEIDEKKNHINYLKDVINYRNITIYNYTNYINKLYQDYIKLINAIEELRKAIRSRELTSSDNSHDVNQPNFSLKDILSTPDSDHFEPEITYGSKSGIIPKAQAYQSLYDQYYHALLAANSIIDNHLQPSIDFLKKTELTGLDYSYETVKNENLLIQDQITENKTKYSTDTKKFFYQSDNFIFLKSVNYVLFILFYVFFIFFIYMVYRTNKITFYYKILFIIIVFFFPFVIKPFEQFIYLILSFMYSLSFGKIYTGEV